MKAELYALATLIKDTAAAPRGLSKTWTSHRGEDYIVSRGNRKTDWLFLIHQMTGKDLLQKLRCWRNIMVYENKIEGKIEMPAQTVKSRSRWQELQFKLSTYEQELMNND